MTENVMIESAPSRICVREALMVTFGTPGIGVVPGVPLGAGDGAIEKVIVLPVCKSGPELPFTAPIFGATVGLGATPVLGLFVKALDGFTPLNGVA